MSEAARPWWASEDPAGHQAEDGSAHGEHTRPAWLDAVEAIDGAVRAATRTARERSVQNAAGTDAAGLDGDGGARGGGGGGARGGGGGGEGGAPDGHRHGAIDAYCHVCPVCSLLRALDETRPEVILHLTEAARHLTMAAKAVVDSQAERAGGQGNDGFESIPVDD